MSLLESLSFVVLWAVVIPLIAAVSLLTALFAFGRSLWLGRFDCGRDEALSR
jgi:hypothetical protein